MANSAAIIGAPTVSDVTEDTNLQTLIAAGMISISDANAGQAAFKTTVISASGNLGTLTIAANGAYSYKVADSAVQYLGAGDTKIDTFTVTSLDGTTKKIDFTIHGVNDAAIIGNVTASEVTEDKTKPTLTTSGKISISDVDQGEASFNTAVISAAGNLGTLTLSSNGSYSYSVANSSAQYLGAGATKIDTFTVTASDGTAKQLSFTIKGVNDAAVIGTPTVHDVTEDAGNPLIATGMISISDADQGEAAFRTTVISAAGNLGTLTLAANGLYSYSVANNAAQYLGASDTKTDTFTVTSLDGTTKQVSFTIHGKNDAAVIGTPTVHDVTEDATQPFLYALGTISISDADQGEAAFKTALISGPGSLGTLVLLSNGSYAYFVADSAVQYLGANDTRVDTFTVTAADGTTQQVSFTIHGTNDVAVIGTPTVRDVTEDSSATTLTATGSISISDADQGQAAFNTSVTSAAGNLGTLTLAANGTYSYSVANGATQFLGANDVKTDSFTIKSVDGTTQQVTFTIHGKNDAAVIGTPTVSDVTANPNAVTLTATGSISISDVDQGQASFKTNVTSAAGNFGQLALASNGTYSYTVAESVAAQLGSSGTKVDTFTVTSLDGTTKQITFTVHGTGSGNHAAVIGTPSVSVVTEDLAVNGSGNLTAAGTISITDADAGQAAFQTSVTSAGGNLGSLVLASNGGYTYTVANSLTQSLGAGATKVDTFTVTSVDGTSKQVTFTINGADDAAVIGTPAVVDVTEDGNLSLSGVLSISDADAGQGSFQTAVTAVGTVLGSLSLAANGAYTYSVLNSATQSLGAGVNKIDTFTITSLDGTTKQVSFTIHGVNDTAVIGPVGIHDVTEDFGISGGNLSLSGTLSISDADTGQGSFQTTVTPVGTNLGTLTLAADGSYTYSVANSATQYLGVNQTKAETFTIASLDGTSQQVTFTIHGTQDAPTLSVTTANGNEDTSIALSISSALIDTTPTESLTLTITGVPAGAVLNHGSADVNGVWHVAGSDIADLALTPASNFSGAISLGVTATSIDSANGNSQASSTTLTLAVDVAGVADAPILTGPSASIEVAASTDAIALNLQVALVDSSETLGAVTISGVTGGYVLSAGVYNSDGDYWLVPANQLAGLTMQPGTADTVGASGEFHLHVTARSIDGGSVATTSTDVTVNVAPDPNSFSSRVVDGYISGATVFSDDNNNGVFDLGEASAITKSDGTFTITGGHGGKLIMSGGVDVSTGLNFSGTLSAVAGSTVITPLTTLVAALAASSSPADIAIAQTAVLNAFGLDSSVDLQSYDPVHAASTGDANATSVLAAGIQVQTTIAQITAAAGSATTGADVVSAVATSISAASGGAVDLSNTATLTSIIQDAAPTASAAAIDAATQVVSAANTAIASAAAGAGDTFSILTNLAQAATVALGQGTDQLAAAAAGTGGATFADAITNNTGTHLTDAIAAAPVGDPDGSQVGTLGNDTISGAGGNDVIDGLDGNDTLSGLAGNDTIHGGNGNDKIFGGDDDDKLFGDDGRDVLTGGAGNDILDGGNLFDRASYTDAPGGITVNLTGHTVSGAGVGTDTLISIEGIVGSDFDDTFDAAGFAEVNGVAGSSIGQNSFEGRGGNDIINGTINAQGQKVTRAEYLSATGAVTVDLVAGTADGDSSVGHDTLTNISSVWGSAYDDIFRGSDNAFGTYETYEGRAGNDFVDGRGGYDQVTYNNDTTTTAGIVVHLAAGTVTGDATVGTDTLRSVEAVRGTNFDDIYDATNFGGVGAVNIGSSGTFNDFGGAGGNDTVIGNGATRLNYALALAGVTVDLETSVIGTTTAVTVAGIATGATEGTDTLTGVNAVQGSTFNDTFYGSSFNNTFTGLNGNDYIDGRGGFDTASYNSLGLATAGVVVNLAAGTAVGDASIGSDTLRSIEGIQGTNYADTFNAVGYGVAGAANVGNNGTFNQFEGLGGNDTITGNGNTRIGYFNATSGVTVSFSGSGAGTATGDTSVGTDTFTGVNSVTGSAFNDTITTDNNSNTLTGGGGNDALNGAGGTDMAIFTGSRSQYAINFNTPGAGQTQVQDNTANRDGTDTLTGIEVLQFSDSYYLIASGSQATPLNLTGLGFNGGVAVRTMTGTNDDFITINGSLSNRLIDLGGGTGDTINLTTGGYNLNLVNVEKLNGSAGDDFVGMLANVNGLAIDMGGGTNDNVNLANGTNTVSAVNVENLNGSDFAVGNISNDTLNLTNNVSGLSVNLANGNNTLNLAAGANSFVNIGNVQHINGTASNDTLNVSSGIFEPGNNPIVDLGAGDNTLNLSSGGGSLTLLNVQHLNGGSGDNFISLNNTVTGLAVDLGGGTNDSLTLASGSNSISATNVENIGSADWNAAASNDTLTLLNTVSGVSLTLQQGFNTLNLASGTNQFTNVWSVDVINGSGLNDTLIIDNGLYTPNNDIVIDLGVGDDTLSLGTQYISLGLLNTEHLNGNSLDNYFSLNNVVSGLAVDLGAGNDGLGLTAGTNSLGLTSVESVNSSDNFGSGPAVDDTLTLLNTVNGLTVNLQQGSNTLNLAAGANSITTYNVQSINGTASDDTLTMINDAGGDTIDLGSGIDTLNLSMFTGGVTVKNIENVNGSADTDFITIVNSTNPTTVTGGGGTDFITLSAGQDNLRYTSASQSAVGAGDVVTNFDASSDTFLLDHVASGQVHFVSSGAFSGTPADHHSEARLNGNVLQIDLDGDGQVGAGDMEITLNGLNGTLSDANFVTTGVNHAPTDISLVGSSVAENSAANTFVGTLSGTDPDAGDTATFSLVNPNGLFAISGNNLVVAGALDYETAASQQVTVRVTDSGGLTYDKVFNIGVTDANDAPTVTSGATASVAENSATSTVVYQATASDPDATAPNNTITWSVTGTDAAAFSIDSGGNVRLNSSANYEAQSSYSINVVATDGGNLSSSQAVTIGVIDVNEAHTITSAATATIAENAPTFTMVYQATSIDTDVPGQPVTWSLTGADAAAFTINNAGMVTLNSSANYEVKSSYSINVVVTDTGAGNPTSSKAVTVNVTDVNEAPTVSSGATATVAENAATSTVVYQALASDPDTTAPNNAITWSLSGTDAAAFSIDGSGQLTLNSSANYELKNTYSLNVIATDGGSLSNTKAVTVSITNVNEAPTDISVSNAAIPQGTSSGTVVGALSAIDPDAGDTATFTLVDGAGGQFGISGGNIVVAGPLSTGAQQVIVRATDALGLTFDKTITITVNAGALVVGDANANTLTGTGGDDTIQGLAGNDTLQGLAGNDLLDGGTGQDAAIYSDATAAITVSMAAGTVAATAADASIGTDTLRSIELVQGSNFADTYDATGYWTGFGTPSANQGSPTFQGNVSNTFEGMGGNDSITGNLRTTASYYHAAAGVTINLSSGATAGSAFTTGGGDAAGVGTDTLINVIYGRGSEFNDVINGGTGNDVLIGGAGNDALNGGTGFDLANYSPSFYYTFTAGIAVTMSSGAVVGGDASIGNDTLRSIESVRGTSFVDNYNATNFGATGFLNTSTNNVGNNGTFNEFEGMGGNDIIVGNSNTRILYYNAAAAVTVDLQAGTATGTAAGDVAAVGTDTISGIAQVRGSSFDDILMGSNTSAFTELFEGWTGNDFIDGRNGFDVALYGNNGITTAGITVNMTTGVVMGDATIGTDTLRGIEGIQGTNFDDTYTATNYSNTGFLDTSNFNVDNAGFGNFNQFEGLAGNDTIIGNGNTRIIYSAATAFVTINLQAGTASGSTVGNDTFVGVNSATGSNSDDVYNAAGYTGVTAAGSFGTFNLFEGLGGNDTITGNGNTRIAYSQAGGSVTVNLATGLVSGAAGNDTISGGVNSVQGSNFNDTITGGSSDETFFGGGGNDTINAGGGNDGITGQGGNDIIDGGAGTDMVSFTGAQNQYNITGSGTIQVANTSGNGDGTDSLTNVEVLQFNNAIVLLSAGTLASPIDISGQGLNVNVTITGTSGDDFLTIGGNAFGHQINLGAGANDTVNIVNGGGSLNLVGVEFVKGTSGDEFVNLVNNAFGLSIDLGAGNDGLNLAAGANTLSLTGVDHVYATDFGASPGIDDTLTLQNNVSGIDISLGNGNNTMNLAAGANSFVTIFDVNHVMGTTGNDTLTIGGISATNGTTVDLGAGDDTFVLNGNYASFSAVGIEHIIGNASENSVNLTNNVTGIDINLGGGIADGVSLASGMNSLSITGVENLSTSDFGGQNPSNDSITLLNTVSGVIVNMGDGTANVLNLAAGSNSFVGLYNVNLINGSASDDTLTLQGGSANVIDLGGGNDSVNFNSNVFDVTVINAENINGSANFDRITIGNTSGNTTITAGVGADEIFASAGHDNFRFASIGDSAAGAADTIHNFDAANDSFTFSGIGITGTHIEYVGTGAFTAGQASAHLEDYGAGNGMLQIDTNGDGLSDMDISLQNFTGTLTNSNFLLS